MVRILLKVSSRDCFNNGSFGLLLPGLNWDLFLFSAFSVL